MELLPFDTYQIFSKTKFIILYFSFVVVRLETLLNLLLFFRKDFSMVPIILDQFYLLNCILLIVASSILLLMVELVTSSETRVSSDITVQVMT